jgi:hypothetical protein
LPAERDARGKVEIERTAWNYFPPQVYGVVPLSSDLGERLSFR